MSTRDEVPEARFGHAATCWRNQVGSFSLAGGIDARLIQMLVFGGMNNENDFADLWILTLPSRIDLLRCTALLL